MIRLHFDLEERYIECKGLKEMLQLTEAQILKYMIDNNGESISSKVILDDNWAYWSDKRVLHKVFFNLRKKFSNYSASFLILAVIVFL
jgi:DNA-binding response OmpR family regulator